MLTITHRYRIYPDITQEQQLIEWIDICRRAYNYALLEIKNWCYSRKCLIDRCSLEKEYILSADLKFPGEIQQLNNLPRAKKEFPSSAEDFELSVGGKLAADNRWVILAQLIPWAEFEEEYAQNF